jgi:DinB superfamily
MAHLHELKKHLLNLLDAEGAHINFDEAVKGFPPKLRGKKPEGAPHTAWQLLEHLRIAQWDILEFSRNAKHVSPKWPEGHWPESETPPNDKAWQESVQQFRDDLEQMKDLLKKVSEEELYKRIPHGDGQTLLREVLILADHNSYHVGQLMYLRKTLEGQQ